MRTIGVVMAIAMTIGAAAQEGTATLPRSYQLRFENEWVKVTSVRYGPNEKLPGHTHTPNPSAYVYLNDGGPVIFRHVGGSAATRPATKAGAFRVYRGLVEVHEVENTTAAPSEFLRVELKTEGRDPATFRGKFERPAAPTTKPMIHVDHPQVRISRLWVQPGQELAIAAGIQPSLLIALAPSGGMAAGQERWVAAGQSAMLTNSSRTATDFLRFDFRTRPLAGS